MREAGVLISQAARVVSDLMDDLGFRVTGPTGQSLCWSGQRPRRRAETGRLPFVWAMRKTPWEPDASYEVVINRHLVWTLVDPKAAFREWMWF